MVTGSLQCSANEDYLGTHGIRFAVAGIMECLQ